LTLDGIDCGEIVFGEATIMTDFSSYYDGIMGLSVGGLS